jgi:hypothetical protein
MNRSNASSFWDEQQKLRAKSIRDDISKRLRRVCSHLSDEEFDALVDKMTKNQLHSEGRSV